MNDPLLLEMMGPPGAGKTTVFRELCRVSDRIAATPVLRKPPHTARLAWHMLLSGGTLVGTRALDREWSLRLLAMMAYVRALPGAVTGRGAPDADAVVFDQGPLYTLARPHLRDPKLAEWRQRSLELWRPLLDAVVWLDAPGEELWQRIDGRPHGHRLRGGGPAAVSAEAAENRETYERVLAAMDGGPQVLRFDTGEQPPAAVAAQVIDFIRSR